MAPKRRPPLAARATDDEFAARRRSMVEKQLRPRGVYDPRVLAAMEAVPRELFVAVESAPAAYHDKALAIEAGQTISQPLIVALMTQALELAGDERVLEIGAGSGYQAAILSLLCRQVVTVERHPALAEAAARRLAELGYANVEVRVGDGTLGCPDAAPFDRILVAAAAPAVPPALWRQLVEGGILAIPVGDQEAQTLHAIRKEGDLVATTDLGPVRFVKLIGEAGWPDEPA